MKMKYVPDWFKQISNK